MRLLELAGDRLDFSPPLAGCRSGSARLEEVIGRRRAAGGGRRTRVS